MHLIKTLEKSRGKLDGSTGIKWSCIDSKGDSQKDIDKQFYLDLKEFADKLKDYVFVNLNKNRRAAILSFAHSIGIQSFKNCKLLELINSYSSKTKIIREWSPYINTYWMSGGDLMVV